MQCACLVSHFDPNECREAKSQWTKMAEEKKKPRAKVKYDFPLIEFKSDANVKDDPSSGKYGEPWAALWSLAASYSSLFLFYSIKTEMCHFQVHWWHKFRCVLVRCSGADSEFTLVKLCPCRCSGWTNSKTVVVRENAGIIILAASITIFTTFITLTEKKKKKNMLLLSWHWTFFSLWELAQQALCHLYNTSRHFVILDVITGTSIRQRNRFSDICTSFSLEPFRCEKRREADSYSPLKVCWNLLIIFSIIVCF